MSKEKKNKSSTEKNIVNFEGKVLKIKKAKNTDLTPDEYYPVLPFTFLQKSKKEKSSKHAFKSFDAGIMESYLAVSREKMIPSEKTGFCREYRKKDLVLSTFSRFESPIENGMCIAYSLISEFIHDNYGLEIDRMDFPPLFNVEIKEDIKIERIPNKFLYFRLSKDSDTFPGLSRQMSNYIIDNCAAIVRIMCYRHKEEDMTFISNEMIEDSIQKENDLVYVDPSFLYGITSFDLPELLLKDGVRAKDERFEKWAKALDIRTALFGDIETMLINMNDENGVVFFCSEIRQEINANMELGFRLNDCPKYISALFGIPVYIVTNPYELYQIDKYGIEISDLIKYGLI